MARSSLVRQSVIWPSSMPSGMTARWVIDYGGSSAAGLLTLRKRSAAGVWSTAGTQALATGAQRYTGSVSLASGESLGAHVGSFEGGVSTLGPEFFFGAG